MDGLTKEQRQRSSLIASLDDLQTKLILSGVLGILNSMTTYEFATYTKQDIAEELLDDIDTMIAKAYEKGMYS